MSDRMTDERLAELDDWTIASARPQRELVDALVAERGRVLRLEAALTDLASAHELVGLIAARHVLAVHASPVQVTADVATIDGGLGSLIRARDVLAEGTTT